MNKKMREKVELLNTFSNYRNGFVAEMAYNVDFQEALRFHNLAPTHQVERENSVDFVKRFCNIEELEVKVDDGEYIYRCDADEITQRKSEWNLEQHAVWHAWNCALSSDDEEVEMYEYAIRTLLALAV